MTEGPRDPSDETELRDGPSELAGMRVAELAEYDVGAGLARFESALAAGAGTTSAATVGVSGASASSILTGLAAVVGIAAIAAAIWVGREDPPSPGDSDTTSAVSVVEVGAPGPEEAADAGVLGEAHHGAEVATASEIVETRDVLVETDSESAEPADAPAPRPRARPPLAHRPAPPSEATTPPKPAAEPATPPSGPTELEHTAAMKKALASDPARALALAEEGQRRFPDGMFARERAAYAVLALVELGRDQAARQRANAFLARYPKGPLAERVRTTAGVP
jgi:hypothetical protein